MKVNRRRVLQWVASGFTNGLFTVKSEPRAIAKRIVELRCEVAVPGASSSVVSLWLPVPKSDSYQTIDSLRFSGVDRQEIHTDSRHGNRYFFTQVPAGRQVAMTFRVTRAERHPGVGAPGASLVLPACCLGPDRLVPLDDRIRGWAQVVAKNARAQTDLEKARAIYEHVVDTVKYDKSGHGWGRGDIYYACDARRGNCSDFHAIFIGYARALGIPAKFAIGLPLPRVHGSGEIAGYHCWAEFFSQGVGWVPIDASEAAKDPQRRKYFFGALDENRVEFSQGRDLVLTPRQAGEPLNFFVHPYAEQGGRKVENLSSRVMYRDV